MKTQQALADSLTALALEHYLDPETRIHTEPNGRVYGVIVSRSFEGIDEERRQADLYATIARELGEEALQGLLFVFTNTPDEDEIFERNTALASR
ncbi:MAG: hypothetical protein H6744_08325 [Deltaproteobacteria bacterium]|nr:hypothetical protein [Deltaproteobacteria bacterium]MCB9786682.1 hypothetical protein [Deltaproteobacteria bacterium]